MLAYFLIILGVASRLIVHVPNFTPVIAIALFSGVYLKKKYAVVLMLALMAITDVLIGFHNIMFFTWGSFALIAVLGTTMKGKVNFKSVFSGSLLAAILFFVATNFGVWLVSGMYARSLAGLVTCFTMAIPFFRYTAASAFIYSFVLFGGYELIASRIKSTRLATAL
ncbi:MAG: hypothetical protein KKD07_08440 [Candidatus Omnitrophica bacterium]|nr:hypothetical protein [Candidatus Omnitrophota bacterium]MBU1995761.1 hypothetical protein [Candidatus Omnitrophota bacterium]MBU4334452.1 hypothetical protein [Candidatus Omnitrophota bacterium]